MRGADSLQNCYRNNKKMILLSSAHLVNDDLIYFRYGRTLAKSGYDVSIMAVDNCSKIDENINVIPLKKYNSRFLRFTVGNLVMLFKCLKEKDATFFLFTPDLIIIGFLLKIFIKCNVVNCVIENYRLKILSKTWICEFLRKYISRMYGASEEKLCKKFDLNVFVDSFTLGNYSNNIKKILLPNYPQIEEYIDRVLSNTKETDSVLKLVYVGGISKGRGFEIMQRVLDKIDIDCEIHLYGPLQPESLKSELANYENLIYHGLLEWDRIIPELLKYDIGLCLFENIPAYEYAAENTTKLFEYMFTKLPVLSSNFKGLAKIIDENKCGICVNPDDIDEICAAIKRLYNNENERLEMGVNGQKAVLNNLNWDEQGKKLIEALEGMY